VNDSSELFPARLALYGDGVLGVTRGRLKGEEVRVLALAGALYL
jgi:hypothetical protein